jgi:hypothetical protein
MSHRKYLVAFITAAVLCGSLALASVDDCPTCENNNTQVCNDDSLACSLYHLLFGVELRTDFMKLPSESIMEQNGLELRTKDQRLA